MTPLVSLENCWAWIVRVLDPLLTFDRLKKVTHLFNLQFYLDLIFICLNFSEGLIGFFTIAQLRLYLGSYPSDEIFEVVILVISTGPKNVSVES